MTSLLQNGKQQFIDQNGRPLVGGNVYFYAPGTENPMTTWQDQAQTIPNTDPVVLDSRGQATIWGSGTYRQVVYDRNGNLIWDQVVSEPGASLGTSGGSALIGFLQSGAGAVAQTLQDQMRAIVTPANFGAVGDGVADDTAALQRWFNAVFYSYVTDRRTRVGMCYGWERFRITAPVFPTVPCFLRMNGARIVPDPSVMTSGTAVVVQGVASSRGTGELELIVQGPYGGESVSQPPSAPSGTLDGIRIDGTAGQVNNMDLRVWVEGFRHNYRIGPQNVWALQHKRFVSGKFWATGIYFDCVTNAGEGIDFDAVLFYNGVAAAASPAVCVFAPQTNDIGAVTNQFLDVAFRGKPKFDYCDKVFVINSGLFKFADPHFENNNNLSLGDMTYVSGFNHPIVVIDAGAFYNGNLGSSGYIAAESTGGRPSLFTTNGACGILIHDFVPGQNGKNYNSEVVTTNNGQVPFKMTVEPVIDTSGLSPIPSWALNNLYNNGFESNFTGWVQNTSGAVVASIGASLGPVGTNSARLDCDGTASGSITQNVPCKPGQSLIIDALIKANTTGGDGRIRVDFLAADGTVVSTVSPVGSTVSGNTGAVRVGTLLRVPTAASQAKVQCFANQPTGTLWFDNLYARAI